jgi:uncharacterized C2H2 Zn-finger protein
MNKNNWRCPKCHCVTTVEKEMRRTETHFCGYCGEMRLACGCVTRPDGSTISRCPRHDYLFNEVSEGGVGL